jgi:hypothetical protein
MPTSVSLLNSAKLMANADLVMAPAGSACGAVDLSGTDATADRNTCEAAGACTYTPDDAGTAGVDEESCAATTALTVSRTTLTSAVPAVFSAAVTAADISSPVGSSSVGSGLSIASGAGHGTTCTGTVTSTSGNCAEVAAFVASGAVGDCPTGDGCTFTENAGGDVTIASGVGAGSGLAGNLLLKTGTATQMTVTPTTVTISPDGTNTVATVEATGVTLAEDLTLATGKVLKTAAGQGAVGLAPEGTTVLSVAPNAVTSEKNLVLNGGSKLLGHGDVFLSPGTTAANAAACSAVNLAGADAAADQASCVAAGECTYTPDDAGTAGTNEEACAATTGLQHEVNCAAVDLSGTDAAVDLASCEAAGMCTYTPDDAGTAGTNEEACAATIAMTVSTTKATLAAGVHMELSATSDLVSADATMNLRVTDSGTLETALGLTGDAVQPFSPLVLQSGSSLMSQGGNMGEVIDMVVSAGTGTGQNAKGGAVTISAGNPVTNADGSVNYGQCDSNVAMGGSYNPGNLIDLSLADFNALTAACSPGDIKIQSDTATGGTLTQMLITETVDLEDSPVKSNGKMEFRVDNIKVMELSQGKVETFVPMTVNGFDLQVSDRRIKRNITDASNSDSLDIFRKLRLREYHLHDTYAASSQNQNEKAAKGFIAQEVAEILPHAVKQFDRTFEAPGYDDLVIKKMNHVQYDYIYLEMVGAVKELIDEKDQMDEDLKALRAEVQTLKDEKAEAEAATAKSESESESESPELEEMRALRDEVKAMRDEMRAMLTQ